MSERETVIITGVSGNLGRRLVAQLQELQDFSLVGVDFQPPDDASTLARFEELDFGTEASCEGLARTIRETDARAVVHLAFVLDPLQTGVLDQERMWQINVAGTARVMEAISVVNRHGGNVEKFVYPSSVAVYGPDTPSLVREDYRLGARSLTYAIHKQECEEVVRYRQEWMGDTHTYMLRPAIFTGPTVENYMIGALRGTAGGKGRRAERMRAHGKRLPILLPWGRSYTEKKLQFVHVDDVARLIAHILRRKTESDHPLTVLNVAGRGEPLTIAQCARIAGAKIRRVPTRAVCRLILQKYWDWKVSSIPPEALPYMIGSYTMDTSWLRSFLGKEYQDVIRFTVEEALKDGL